MKKLMAVLAAVSAMMQVACVADVLWTGTGGVVDIPADVTFAPTASFPSGVTFTGVGTFRPATVAPLISKHFAFRDYAEAYRYIDANRESTMKVIVDVDA